MQMSFWVEQVYVDSNPSPTAYPPALIFLSSNVKMSFFKKKKNKAQMLKEMPHFEIRAFDGAADDRW